VPLLRGGGSGSGGLSCHRASPGSLQSELCGRHLVSDNTWPGGWPEVGTNVRLRVEIIWDREIMNT
jgi:hypothetical protein